MASVSFNKSANYSSLGAPGVVVNEHDYSQYTPTFQLKSPVTLIFGFSPKGTLLKPLYFNSIEKMVDEFGEPETSLEKYFMNAGIEVIQNGGTALMTRLPYDNDQANTIKYVRYAVGAPVHRKYVYESEKSHEMFLNYDRDGVEVLDELHELDNSLNGYSRITLDGGIRTMSESEYEDVCLSGEGIEQDSIYIFDIKRQQLGTNPLLSNPDAEYLGVVPVLVTPSTALYIQEKIANNPESDKIFNLLTAIPITDTDGRVRLDPNSIVVDRPWKDESEQDKEAIQETIESIFTNFSQTTYFTHSNTSFYNKRSVGDSAALQFPLIRYNSPDRFEKKLFDQIGIVVFELVFNRDTEKVDFVMREAFCGYISNIDSRHPALEIEVNNKSKYIHLIRKIRHSTYRDYFHISNQPLVIFGMGKEQVMKKLHYKKSLMEPIQHMLDTYYSDVDSCIIDVILDAGMTTLAHYAWKKYLDTTTPLQDENGDIIYERDDEGEIIYDDNGNPIPVLAYGPNNTFYFNPMEDNVEGVEKDGMTPNLSEVECCSTAWNNLVKMISGFIKTTRGECVFVADGPRFLNLSRNVPITQRYPKLANIDLLNRSLKYFSTINTSFASRIYNWVLYPDYFSGLSLWLPPSIVAGALIANSEKASFPWYAPSGFNRGVSAKATKVSIRTKPYTDENDFLYLNRWNYFTENINVGVVLEGNKTMQVETTALDRFNVRRLCNYIKRQIRNISNRYKYEPNTLGLRMQYQEELGSMLHVVRNNAGISDFKIICNDRNNTADVIDRNELRCQVWIKPIKVAEFIIVDVGITNQGVVFNEGFANGR